MVARTMRDFSNVGAAFVAVILYFWLFVEVQAVECPKVQDDPAPPPIAELGPEPGFRSSDRVLVIDHPEEVRSTRLALDALDSQVLGWMSLPPVGDEGFSAREGESVGDVRRRIAEVARAATLLGIAQPIWPNDDGTKTARLLVCVAFYESRFRGYVDDGRCNDPDWRASPEGVRTMRLGTCDGGRARSLWQLHDFRGDRQQAMQEALRRLRFSIRAMGDLRGYTGERGPDAPKARVRLACADRTD